VVGGNHGERVGEGDEVDGTAGVNRRSGRGPRGEEKLAEGREREMRSASA
jgi:hypothetical protein